MSGKEVNKQNGTIIESEAVPSVSPGGFFPFLNKNAKFILPILLMAFFAMAGYLWLQSLQASDILSFCADNGYFHAGTKEKETICFNYNETEITYQAFTCQADGLCGLTGKPGFIPITNTNGYMVNLT